MVLHWRRFDIWMRVYPCDFVDIPVEQNRARDGARLGCELWLEKTAF